MNSQHEGAPGSPAERPLRLAPKEAAARLRAFADDHGGRVLATIDVFDTLLHRDCHRPADAFRLMARSRIAKFSPLAAERRLAAGLAACWADPHASLERIIGCFPGGWSASQELEFEESILRPNAILFQEAARMARQPGAILALASDMYLSPAQVARLLAACGFPIEGAASVWTSSASRASKARGGALFAAIRAKLDPGRELPWIHVGDSFEADWAASAGADARILCHSAATCEPDAHAAMALAPLAERSRWAALANDRLLGARP